MNAIYVSIWDGGFRVETRCKYNPETKEVTDVDSIDVDEMDLDICDEEFIVLSDGTEMKSFNMDGGTWENGQRIEEI